MTQITGDAIVTNEIKIRAWVYIMFSKATPTIRHKIEEQILIGAIYSCLSCELAFKQQKECHWKAKPKEIVEKCPRCQSRMIGVAIKFGSKGKPLSEVWFYDESPGGHLPAFVGIMKEAATPERLAQLALEAVQTEFIRSDFNNQGKLFDLFEKPISENPNYRIRVVVELPNKKSEPGKIVDFFPVMTV